MKVQTNKHKGSYHQQSFRSISNCGRKENSPLTTADLTVSAFHFFSEKIEFKTVFRPELWPRRKIVLITYISRDTLLNC